MKNAYALITTHELDPDHIEHMRINMFQRGDLAFEYLQRTCQQPIDKLKLRDMNKEWDDLDIQVNAGVNENSVSLMAKKIRALNSKRPAADRFDRTKMTERLLELIFTCSKHFSQSALTEYNAQPADWAFVVPGAAAGAVEPYVRNAPPL